MVCQGDEPGLLEVGKRLTRGCDEVLWSWAEARAEARIQVRACGHAEPIGIVASGPGGPGLAGLLRVWLVVARIAAF